MAFQHAHGPHPVEEHGLQIFGVRCGCVRFRNLARRPLRIGGRERADGETDPNRDPRLSHRSLEDPHSPPSGAYCVILHPAASAHHGSLGHRGTLTSPRLLGGFLLLAQYFFIRSACCLRCAAVKVRFFLAGAARGVAAAAPTAAAGGFFRGRPRRVAGPCRASIARFSLSRS